MIQLYYHPRSTFSRRVHMVLLEKSLPFQLVELDMRGGEHKRAPYLTLNPYGRVPTLVEDGFVLYESTAIVEYLEATRPEPSLSPNDAKDRARMAMHMKLADVEFGSATGPLIFPTRFVPKEKWDLDAMGKSRERVQRHLDILTQEIAGRTWLVGERYSLADVCYAPFLEFLEPLGLRVSGAIGAWAARVLARPSAVATKPDR